MITLEQLTHENYTKALEIDRSDIPEEWVDTVPTLMEITDYGAEHGLTGHTFLAADAERYVGIIMIGEALSWDTDPDEMKDRPFYRVMGFAVDKAHRGNGIGGQMLERAIKEVHREFGYRPLALGVHRDNTRVRTFYERHGFRPTGVFEGNDEYFLRLNEPDRTEL